MEVDRGTERQKQVIEKIDRYVYAYEHSDKYHGEVFPTVVFLAPHAVAVGELRQIVGRAQNVPDGLIHVLKLDRFPQAVR